MPRDPFFTSRAAECAANIAMATLRDLGPGVFKLIDCMADGDVVATLNNGVVLTVRWEVESQSLRQVHRHDPHARFRMVEMEIAA